MGCAIACSAALANLSYEKMRTYFENAKTKERTSGFYNRDIIKALNKIQITAKAFSIKKWGSRRLKSGSIVFIGRSKFYPFGHYILKTKIGWMNSWVNYPTNPIKAGFQKKVPGKVKWVIQVKKFV